MSRKFNTKKFIKDVLNDRYALVIPLWYRSSQEAGKKQFREWLQYVCGVTEMFLDEPSGKAEREGGSKWCATSNTCSSANEAGFVTSRTYVYVTTEICL